MATPSVHTLLNGYLMPTDQGNPAFCAVYLIESDDGGIVFDCGHVGRRKALLAALCERGLSPGDIATVVVSHGHWDHLQNVDLFQRARVILHPHELRYLKAPSRRDLGTPPWTSAVLDGLDVREASEGEQLASGVRVVELPGHTPGSIGLAVDTEDGTAVLTGDAVPAAGVLFAGEPLGRAFDSARARASIERVAELADVVHPGHDKSFRVTRAERSR
jgi:glyoxylase-like metal-dependent hydrolase (beta-lactamase superfamily II)